MNQTRIPHSGDFYEHFKNKLYQIISVAEHSETGEPFVVYQALYGQFKTYIRPLDMFLSEVDREKYPEAKQIYRFTQVGDNVYQYLTGADKANIEATKEEATIKEAMIKEAAIEEVAIKEAAIEEAMIKEVAIEEVAIKEAAIEEAMIKEVAIEEVAIKEAMIKEVAIKEVAIEESMIKEVAKEEAAIEEATIKKVVEKIETVTNIAEETVNPFLLEFLDADTFGEKLEVLRSGKSAITDRLINDLAVVLDVVIEEGEIEQRYDALKSSLETFKKYECTRFQRR